MEPAAARLKRLRESTNPKLTIRAMAEMLGMPTSSYAFYEDSSKAKKPYLPAQFTRSLIEPFRLHGVDAADVLALGGLEPKSVAANDQNGPADDGADQAPSNVLTDQERAILRITAGASPEQFIAISDFMRGRIEAIDASASAAQQLDAVLLPEVEVSYSMGAGTDIEDYPVTQLVPFSRTWLDGLTRSPPSMLFVARGDGDSMMPTILDQDIVIIDRSERTLRQQDRIWAVAYGGFGMIKRLRSLPDGSLQINSDNPAVTPIQAYDDEAFIIGRVVGIIRRI